MSRYESVARARKFRRTANKIVENNGEIDKILSFNIDSKPRHTFNTYFTYNLNTELTFVDLYKFTGVTFTNNAEVAVPAELYDFDGNFYSFNLPIFGYSSPAGEDPNNTIGGTWEFQTTAAKVKDSVFLAGLTDQIVSESRVVSYLYTDDDNVEVPDLQFLIDPVDEVYLEYNNFHRWIKKDNGFLFEYYAIFPYSGDVDIKLDARLILINAGDKNAVESYKV